MFARRWLLAGVLALAACGRGQGDALVSGRGVRIGEQDFRQAMLGARKNLDPAAARELLERMTTWELFAREAEARGYLGRPEVVRAARAAALALMIKEREAELAAEVQALSPEALAAAWARAGRAEGAPPAEPAMRRAVVKARAAEERQRRAEELRRQRAVNVDDARLARLLADPALVQLAPVATAR
jgi:hypothetical protein